MLDASLECPTLAVVPARGGSKRIPRKNIRSFLGVPLLTRTIGLLRSAEMFDRIVVSTDDDEIAEIAVSAGAEVPFRRPAALAGETVPTLPVVEHAVRTMAGLGFAAPAVCCVYPTAVLLEVGDIRQAFEILCRSSADYVLAATSFPYPIQRGLRRNPDGTCAMLWPEHREARSQDLEPVFHDAGQFYWGSQDAWLEQRPLFATASRMLILPRYRVQDIDTLEDWQRAELVFEMLRRER